VVAGDSEKQVLDRMRATTVLAGIFVPDTFIPTATPTILETDVTVNAPELAEPVGVTVAAKQWPALKSSVLNDAHIDETMAIKNTLILDQGI
jgi:hypothetical protein